MSVSDRPCFCISITLSSVTILICCFRSFYLFLWF
jgi:hypothetical protein